MYLNCFIHSTINNTNKIGLGKRKNTIDMCFALEESMKYHRDNAVTTRWCDGNDGGPSWAADRGPDGAQWGLLGAPGGAALALWGHSVIWRNETGPLIPRVSAHHGIPRSGP